MVVCKKPSKRKNDHVKEVIDRLKKAFKILFWSYLIYLILVIIIRTVPRLWKWAVA